MGRSNSLPFFQRVELANALLPGGRLYEYALKTPPKDLRWTRATMVEWIRTNLGIPVTNYMLQRIEQEIPAEQDWRKHYYEKYNRTPLQTGVNRNPDPSGSSSLRKRVEVLEAAIDDLSARLDEILDDLTGSSETPATPTVRPSSTFRPSEIS